tara:strand:- start:357 stop:545 length:189 start_codon:yes stop_codon:yes gene_type:complete
VVEDQVEMILVVELEEVVQQIKEMLEELVYLVDHLVLLEEEVVEELDPLEQLVVHLETAEMV